LRRKAGAHKGDRRCFVASAAIGSGCAPEVDLLRRFRDEALLCTGWGRAAVAVYYLVGPLLARLISANTLLRRCTEVLLVRPAARLAGYWLATASSRFGLGRAAAVDKVDPCRQARADARAAVHADSSAIHIVHDEHLALIARHGSGRDERVWHDAQAGPWSQVQAGDPGRELPRVACAVARAASRCQPPYSTKLTQRMT